MEFIICKVDCLYPFILIFTSFICITTCPKCTWSQNEMMVNYDKNRKLKIHFFEDLAQFVTNSPNFCKKIRKNCFLEHLLQAGGMEWKNNSTTWKLVNVWLRMGFQFTLSWNLCRIQFSSQLQITSFKYRLIVKNI